MRAEGVKIRWLGAGAAPTCVRVQRFPLLLKLTEVPLLLRNVPLSAFVSVGST